MEKNRQNYESFEYNEDDEDEQEYEDKSYQTNEINQNMIQKIKEISNFQDQQLNELNIMIKDQRNKQQEIEIEEMYETANNTIRSDEQYYSEEGDTKQYEAEQIINKKFNQFQIRDGEEVEFLQEQITNEDRSLQLQLEDNEVNNIYQFIESNVNDQSVINNIIKDHDTYMDSYNENLHEQIFQQEQMESQNRPFSAADNDNKKYKRPKTVDVFGKINKKPSQQSYKELQNNEMQPQNYNTSYQNQNSNMIYQYPNASLFSNASGKNPMISNTMISNREKSEQILNRLDNFINEIEENQYEYGNLSEQGLVSDRILE